VSGEPGLGRALRVAPLTVQLEDDQRVALRRHDGKEETLVYYDAADKKLKIDTRKSSLGEGPKKTEAGPFELGAAESLKLQVFVDKSVVEVFANDRQAVMRRIYPSRADSVGVKLFSKGGSASVRKLQAWDMMPANAH
jgi:beta-fructofuranosidase